MLHNGARRFIHSASLEVQQQRNALGKQVLRAVIDILLEEHHVALVKREWAADALEQRVPRLRPPPAHPCAYLVH